MSDIMQIICQQLSVGFARVCIAEGAAPRLSKTAFWLKAASFVGFLYATYVVIYNKAYTNFIL
jgi:hypothetical protein